jgi:hypothetical protein
MSGEPAAADHSSLVFNLAPFDIMVDASLASILGEDLTAIDASASCTVDVSLSVVKALFQFESDSEDMTDAVPDDLKYKFVYTTSVDADDVPTPLKSDLFKSTIMSENAIYSGAASKKSVTNDFVRYLAQCIFNTHFGVDLFSNEEFLNDDLDAKSRTALDTVFQGLNEKGIVTGSETNHPSKLVLGKILYSDAPRVKDITTLSVGSNWYNAPLYGGDSIVFKLTIKPASGQHNVLGTNVLTEIGGRSYKIVMNLVDDSA